MSASAEIRVVITVVGVNAIRCEDKRLQRSNLSVHPST